MDVSKYKTLSKDSKLYDGSDNFLSELSAWRGLDALFTSLSSFPLPTILKTKDSRL